jgi:hypothetical protein
MREHNKTHADRMGNIVPELVSLKTFFSESSLFDLQFCLQEAFSCGAVPVLVLSHNVSVQLLIKFALL